MSTIKEFYFLLKNKFLQRLIKQRFGRSYYAKVHKNSPYSSLDISDFIKQIKLHIARKESIIDFDEDFYRHANKDIDESIALGLTDAGFSHFCIYGHKEGRLWSHSKITSPYKVSPNYPIGMFAPVNIKPVPLSQPVLNKLPKSESPFLLLLIGHLQKEVFYAGYTEFFRDFLPVFDRFSKIVVSVESNISEPELATQYSEKIEVIHQQQLKEITAMPDVIVCINHTLFHLAASLFGDLSKIVYCAMEYEAGFFPYGSDFIEAERAIFNSGNIIISTVLLRDFLQKKNLLEGKRIFITHPKIEYFEVNPARSKKLFFYFRPEFFNSRNIAEILWKTVHEFCNKHTGYQIFLVGTIDTRFSFEINGTPVFVLSKMPKNEYLSLISSCDVAVSMIYSAHPGVIAFQTAASGIPTVTNVFDNRDADKLKQISDNLVPYDPIRESLLDKIEIALTMPKGKKSFHEEFYSGKKEANTLVDFVEEVWK